MGFDPISFAVDAASWIASAVSASAPAEATAETATAATAASTPGWLSSLAYGAQAASAIGGVTGAIGAKQQADAQARAAEYNAAVQAQNAAQASQNAAIASQAGEAQFGIQGQRGRATVGAMLAEQGASGIDPTTGSPRQVRQSAADLAQLNALTVRSNAIRQAYGYQTESTSEKAQAQLSRQEAGYAKKAGDISEASTFLGGIGSAADKFAQWQLSSGKSLSVGT